MYWKTSLVLVCLTLKMVFGIEPQCSPFHYQEQMIEKMVKLEIFVQKMKDDMTLLQQRVLDEITSLNEDKKLFKSDLEIEKTSLRKYAKEYEAIKDSAVSPTVVFYAKEVTNTALVSGATFIYKTIVLNDGNGYDNTTGRFTAPLGGTYLFTVQFCLLSGGSNYVYYAIVLDGVEMKKGLFYDNDNTKCYTADVIVVLKSGSQVWVTGPSVSGSLSQASDRWNTFSGVLLH